MGPTPDPQDPTYNDSDVFLPSETDKAPHTPGLPLTDMLGTDTETSGGTDRNTQDDIDRDRATPRMPLDALLQTRTGTSEKDRPPTPMPECKATGTSGASDDLCPLTRGRCTSTPNMSLNDGSLPDFSAGEDFHYSIGMAMSGHDTLRLGQDVLRKLAALPPDSTLTSSYQPSPSLVS